MRVKFSVISLVLALNAGVGVAADNASGNVSFEKFEIAERHIEILYKKLPSTAFSKESVIRVSPEPGSLDWCAGAIRKQLSEAGFNMQVVKGGSGANFTCKGIYAGFGAGLYGDKEGRSLLSYLGQGLGIVAQIGLAVAGGKVAMDLGGAGAANITATNILTDTRGGQAATPEKLAIERNTLFKDNEYVSVTRICNTTTKDCGLVLGIIHKDTDEVADVIAMQRASLPIFAAVANIVVSEQTGGE